MRRKIAMLCCMALTNTALEYNGRRVFSAKGGKGWSGLRLSAT